MHLPTYFLAILMAISAAMAHMEMKRPLPMKSRFDPANRAPTTDYNNNSPLWPDGSNFPCRGHHRTTPWRTASTFTAGQRDYIELAPGASHNGGSCQISLSYDNGQTFHVIQSYMGGCPLSSKWDFQIPDSAPNGRALFAWTWFNLSGNREMYMNCAQVEVRGGAESSIESFNELPEIFVANVGNGCATVEKKHTVFKEPGENVGYNGVQKSDPPFPLCGANL
ncbi:endoglucanase [Aspergillus steynii IBT 23096]|uniref:Endoglucanase n=1 Tax=Aspergillus steynii IBT 23096 TaxID=1392250 RepID=A0A2I2GLQ7_9EURO|nr:endoglucanase [Aspergillus steynii IBT 23096]PLB53804.1 endoglucanase [Aspergillus steynii IBT 23096]